MSQVGRGDWYPQNNLFPVTDEDMAGSVAGGRDRDDLKTTPEKRVRLIGDLNATDFFR
jgi:hypothetical protein